jgi:hypothetical protein
MGEEPDTTPGGCHRDNYRAFTTAGFSWASPNTGVLRFADGKIYEVGPTFWAEWRVKIMQAEDPGCWFNHVLRRRPDYHARRLDTWPVHLDAEQAW